jgi:hypothetical protein
MPNGTLPFERVASIASLVADTASKIGQPREDAASTAGRHCLLEAKFRELLPCAGFVRLGSEQWPISFTPSPKTATSSRWMISFFFSRCRRGQIFSEFRSPRPVPEIPRIVAVHWSLCQRSQAESSMDRHDRCIPNSIRILGGRTREGIWVGSQSRLSCPQDRGGGTLRRRGGRFSRNSGPRHCGIIVGSVVVWLLLAGFSRRGILLL